jgi:hypothetical protein
MRLIFCIAAIIIFSSCKNDESKPIADIKIERFDLDMKAFDTAQFEKSEEKMHAKYGDIYSFYIEKLMGIGAYRPVTDPYYYKKFLPQFLAGEYPAMMDTCDKYVAKDISKFEKELTNCYSYLLFQFPEKKMSKIYSFFISPMGANPQAAFSYGQDTIGFNWFNYLGRNFSLYPSLNEGYTYTIEWNSPEYLTRNIMLVEYNLLKEKYPSQENASELIYAMIEEGKKYYFLDKVCKETKDHTKIGYNEEHLKWCIENEFEIWAYIKENKLLYTIDNMDVKRMTTEGPTTAGMPAASPGMVGSWIGWQIVRKYMASKPSTSLKDLLKMSPKEIFKESGYKPVK